MRRKGGQDGPWNFALASRRSDPDHHSDRASVPLEAAPDLPRSTQLTETGAGRSHGYAFRPASGDLHKMTQTTVAARAPLSMATAVDAAIDTASGVSWPAVIAGAFVASAFSLALVALGAGIGLVSVSPWSSNNPSVTTFTVLAAAWFIAVQLFSSGVGGYIAGRLRTRGPDVDTDEVFFRDTAHGLLGGAVGA